MADHEDRAGARCVALVGPFASGKTSLLEAILARTGAITRQGRISDGNTKGDSSPEARAHGMGVEANIAETEFMGDTYTFIDCPGSVEFMAEADPVLAGADLAVVVTEADEKKVPALQVILHDLETRKIPHVLFLNKLDKISGSVGAVLDMLQPASRIPLVLRQIPLRQDDQITGFIDLALERAYVFKKGTPSERVEMPSGERDREHDARFHMLEQVADFDDHMLEELLEDIDPTKDEVFGDLMRETREGLICPVFIGSAEEGHGITRLMKALRHDMPGLEVLQARLGVNPNGPTAVQVLKTIQSTHGGKLSVGRVLAGKVEETSQFATPQGSENRAAGLFRVMGGDATKREAAIAGETVAIGKLDDVKTGDTLYLAGNGETMGNLYQMPAHQPVMARTVLTQDRKDDVRLSAALAKILEEDPSLRLVQNAETGETVLEGQGEMHLRVTIERLTGKYGIAVSSGQPSIAYRETIGKPVTQRGRLKKQSGGHGQFGDVVLDIKPLPRGEGIAFEETITGGVVPKQYFSSVESGVRDLLTTAGPLGFPVVDVAVTLTDGSYHTVDSSDMAFKSAAQIAMRDGLPQCSPVLLEPVDKVTVFCPNDATPKINAILSGRRGQILGSDAREGWDGWDEVSALMPTSEIEDLIVELRSATVGVGSFVKSFDHLAELTGRLADDVVAKYAQTKEA